MNQTHDPTRASWVESAQGSTDFPIQNLPFGVFRRRGSADAPRVGVAIGDQILDLAAAQSAAAGFTGKSARAAEACAAPSLNPLMALGREHWTERSPRL